MTVKRIFKQTFLFSLIAGILAVSQAVAEGNSEFDERPVPVKTPPLSYPQAMRRDGISGVVAIKVVINEQGEVEECNVTKSSRSEFDQSAIDAVKRWKFKPASKGGAAVKAHLVIPIKFSMDE